MKNVTFILKIYIGCFVLFQTVSGTPQRHKASDGREYIIETDQKYSWYEAFNECARRDSQLLIIDSAAKNNVIIEMLKTVTGHSFFNFWLGGNDEYSSSVSLNRPFYWLPTGQKLSFSNWAEKGSRNYNSQSHCVLIWNNKFEYRWSAMKCTNNFGFICELNHYVEKYEKALKQQCDAVELVTLLIAYNFNQTYEEKRRKLEYTFKKVDSLKDTSKISKEITEKTITDQQKQITELFREIRVLGDELMASYADVSKRFLEHIKQRIPDIRETC